MSDTGFDPQNPHLPFDLSVGNSILHATILLRHLPGKRVVCAGAWEDREVVAKIYIDRRRARIHAAREAAGMQAMFDRGIVTPRLLRQSQCGTSALLIFERIARAETASAKWAAAEDSQQRSVVLNALLQAVAALHQAGLVQEDLHLGNFLFAGAKLYTLDGASVRIRTSPIAAAEALNNLALLFAQLDPAHDALAPPLYAEYARLRNWTYREKELQSLQRAINRRRKIRKDNYLRKVFRSCSAFATHSDSHRFWVCDRNEDSPALRNLLDDPDRALTAARILKDGRTSTVGVIDIEGRRLLVKRYNIKGLLHGFRRALRPTRAAISWRNAHLLLLSGLTTPKPIAMVEKRWGPFKRSAYFISEYVDAIDCRRLLRDGNLSEEEKTLVVEKMCALFAHMAKLRIGHGDTKASNFLIGEKGISIIDLDAMREYRGAGRAARAHRDDVQRFLENWIAQPSLRAQFERCLNASGKTA